MTDVTEITISLPDELLAILEARIAAGEHVSLDAAIRADLEAASSDRRRVDPGQAQLHDLLDEAQHGPWYDGETVFGELLAECEAEARAKGL